MDRTIAALLVLLRAGLWERTPDNLSLFPLDGKEWEEVYAHACRQAVAGVVYRGVLKLPEEMLPPQRLVFRWIVRIDGIEQRNAATNRVLARMAERFAAHGIRAVLQKGQAVAACYEVPALRECGDIDLYFPVDADREKAERLMEQEGCTLQSRPDGSTLYQWQGMEVEHHPSLLDLQCPEVRKRMEEAVAVQGYGKVTVGENVEFEVPVAGIQLLLLNAHILKHAMGRGVGLRQLCDMARACHALHEVVDREEQRLLYRQAGITEWSRMLYAFLESVLGMPSNYRLYEEADERIVAPLWNIVWRGGNFGQYDGRVAADASAWRRKWNTGLSFWRNARFCMKVAPREALWTFGQLLKGQFK